MNYICRAHGNSKNTLKAKCSENIQEREIVND